MYPVRSRNASQAPSDPGMATLAAWPISSSTENFSSWTMNLTSVRSLPLDAQVRGLKCDLNVVGILIGHSNVSNNLLTLAIVILDIGIF